ncbi:hypothetical protein CU098_003425 [Rhizopus stolonifer]|uniref:Uncharacterized protein n=1 Tax=Rhizopus stolonifer TaxID=4846 RepID=A0A367IXC2_RHIST|nr:hypothetical protein CU098_003425 [Rhizopus stolonifer]
MSHEELDDLLVILHNQENEREDEQFAYMLEEEDTAIVEKFKYGLAQYDEEMFNALCLEFQRNKKRGRRKDQMDFTEQYWLQKHISPRDPTFSFWDHYRIDRSTFDMTVDKCICCSQHSGSILRVLILVVGKEVVNSGRRSGPVQQQQQQHETPFERNLSETPFSTGGLDKDDQVDGLVPENINAQEWPRKRAHYLGIFMDNA